MRVLIVRENKACLSYSQVGLSVLDKKHMHTQHTVGEGIFSLS